MIAGLYLTEDECSLAIIDEGLEVKKIEENQDIVEELGDSGVLAVNAAIESGKDLEQQEEELEDEGYSFVPASMNETLNRRARHLKQLLKEKGKAFEIIRYDPMITSRELAINGDQGLESLGIDPSEIDGSQDFDAVLGVVTSRFYDQDQFEDYGIVIPEPIHNT
jgi:predicted nuclease with RNAse H fold